MDKREAAEKLIKLFGNMNAIGVFHSILVEISKYVIILLFAGYTWHCFSVFFWKSEERKDKIYHRQNRIMYSIHAVCALVLFLNSLDVTLVLIYVLQLVLLVFVNKAYVYVYKNASKMVLNNMLMLLMTGFVMIGRLSRAYVIRQMIFAAAICVAGLFIPLLIEKYKHFNRYGTIYAIAGIVLLALVFVIGKEIYGARNWIKIGGFALQPSEFVKIIYVFFIAAFLAKVKDFKNIMGVGAVAGIHVLILVAEKDLGAALIFFITFIAVLYVASQNLLYLAAGALGGSVAAVIAYKLFAHVQTRVTAWRDPWSTIDGAGYQVAQSLFAIGTGGWFGMGLGEGLPTKIPVAESDFIFAAISEELGAFFAVCLILVEVSCFVMFVNIALKMRRRFYKLTAIGLAVEYIFQVFLTIGGVTKFIPSTGVTLPLVSYGGSSVISTVILFCIIQGMYVLNEDEGEAQDESERRKQESIGEADSRRSQRKRAQAKR